MSIEILSLTLGIAATNCYIVGDSASGEAVLIDPVDDARLLLQTAQDAGWTIKLILATHGHYDHVLASQPLKDLTGAPFYIHHNTPQIARSLPDIGFLQQLFPPIPAPDRLLTDEPETLNVGAITLETLYTPGHAPGHVCFFMREQNTLFGGDCLFAGSIGRTDFPFCDYDTLMDSIFNQILPLGDIGASPARPHAAYDHRPGARDQSLSAARSRTPRWRVIGRRTTFTVCSEEESRMQILNQFSYLFITLAVLLASFILLQRYVVDRRLVAGAMVAITVLSLTGMLLLRPGSSDVATPSQAQQSIYNGKPTFLEFFSNYCAGCLALRPSVDLLVSDIGDDFNILRVDIHTDLGREMRETYGFTYTPEFVLFDRNGQEVWRDHSLPRREQVLNLS